MINTSLLTVPDIIKIGLMALLFWMVLRWAGDKLGVTVPMV